MRVAIDVRSLMEGRHSGVEEYTTQIIRALSLYAPGHTYHLFYSSYKPVQIPPFRENVVVHSFRYPNKVLHTSQLLFSRPRWDRMLPIIPDVVFIPNPHRTPVSHDLPLVSVVHDLGFERFPEFLTFRRRMSHQLLRNPQLLLQNSDHVIAVSQHTKEDVLRLYGVDPNRISVVYSGLHTNSGMPTVVDIQALIRRHHLPEKFLLFIGTMEPRKNIMSVVQAFDAIAHGVPQHLVIAGEQGWKSHELHRALAASAYRDRIHLIGFIPEEEKSALYAAADLFVYPSFYEGFGFPPLEALVAGTPVVTSFNSSLPEVVGKWATLIDPYNTPQLAAVLQEYLLTPTRVPISVRKEIQETYSWERAAKQTISVLEGVV